MPTFSKLAILLNHYQVFLYQNVYMYAEPSAMTVTLSWRRTSDEVQWHWNTFSFQSDNYESPLLLELHSLPSFWSQDRLTKAEIKGLSKQHLEKMVIQKVSGRNRRSDSAVKNLLPKDKNPGLLIGRLILLKWLESHVSLSLSLSSRIWSRWLWCRRHWIQVLVNWESGFKEYKSEQLQDFSLLSFHRMKRRKKKVSFSLEYWILEIQAPISSSSHLID
jgi:hypothetical protein